MNKILFFIIFNFIFFILYEYSYSKDNFIFTDKLYLDLCKSSVEFKKIDKILNSNFKLVLNKLSNEDKKDFILWQKNWIDEGRNLEIENCINNGKSIEWCAINSLKSRNNVIISFLTGKEIIGYPFIRPDRDYDNDVRYGVYNSLSVTDNYDGIIFSNVDIYFDSNNYDFNKIWELAENNNYPVVIKGKMNLVKKGHFKPHMVIGDNSDINIKLNINGKLYTANKCDNDLIDKVYRNNYFNVNLINGWELLNSEDSKFGFRYDFINRKYGCGVGIVFCNKLFNPIDTLIRLSNAISSECEVPFTYPKEVEKYVYFTISEGNNVKMYLCINNSNDKSVIFSMTGKSKEAMAMDMIFLNDIKFNIYNYLPNYLRGY